MPKNAYKQEIVSQIKALSELPVAWENFKGLLVSVKDTILIKGVRYKPFLVTVEKPELGSFELEVSVDVSIRLFAWKYNKDNFTVEVYTRVNSCSGESDSSITGFLKKNFISFDDAVLTYKELLSKPSYKDAIEYLKNEDFSDRYGNKKSSEPSALEHFGGSLW